MEEERIFLTKEQALECLVIQDGLVHNFRPFPMGLVGADWEIESVEKLLEEAEEIEIGGENCRSMNHGLAVLKNKQVYFFEADNKKLAKYEEGKKNE